jgi:hypothetical protein
VEQEEVENRLSRWGWNRKWLMGYRRITNATNERTMIASVAPAVGAGDNVFLTLPFKEIPRELNTFFLGMLNSLVFDYVCRQKMGGINLLFYLAEQLPVLSPFILNQANTQFVKNNLIELIYTSYDLQPFAQDCGYDGPPFPWDEERRALLRAELDAYYAHLYGLNRDELRYILDPQDVYGPDFPGETFRVLKDKEIRQYGEYRSKRLTLEAWDRLFGKGA